MAGEDRVVTISCEELHRWLEKGDEFDLIDVRLPEMYTAAHLPGAHNACVYQVVFPREVRAIIAHAERAVVVYGSSRRSLDARTAAEKLARLGYSRVYAFEGGVSEWREAGHALEGATAEVLPQETHFAVAPRRYVVDLEDSLIEWMGRNANVWHHGTVRLTRGELTAAEGSLSGSFDIDLRTITNRNLEDLSLRQVLIAHLQSDDFFFVERFPLVTFAFDGARVVGTAPAGAANVDIDGVLTLRGVAARLGFSATLVQTEKGGITAEAHFDFDRTRWQVIYGAGRFFEHLGMHVVYEPVSIRLRMVAH